MCCHVAFWIFSVDVGFFLHRTESDLVLFLSTIILLKSILVSSFVFVTSISLYSTRITVFSFSLVAFGIIDFEIINDSNVPMKFNIPNVIINDNDEVYCRVIWNTWYLYKAKYHPVADPGIFHRVWEGIFQIFGKKMTKYREGLQYHFYMYASMIEI